MGGGGGEGTRSSRLNPGQKTKMSQQLKSRRRNLTWSDEEIQLQEFVSSCWFHFGLLQMLNIGNQHTGVHTTAVP